MFRILVSGGRTSRRAWSPGTAAISLAAHAAFFALAGLAAVGTATPPKPQPPLVEWTEIAPPPPPAPPLPVEPAQPATPQPVPVDKTAPVRGESLVLEAPVHVPTTLPLPTVEPVADPAHYNGGKPGDIIGPPVPGDERAPTGNTDPGGELREGSLVDAEALAEVPAVRNGPEVRRALERLYPAVLRDAGVSGRATLQFIVGTDGRVEPASIRVVSATHDAFGEASRRAVERFRFRPARVNGVPVRVLIAIPIDWVAPSP